MATKSGVADAPVLWSGLLSSANYSAADTYLFMKAGSASGEATTASTGEEAIGIRQNKPASGEPCLLAIHGVSLLKLGSGGATHGNELKSDSSGQGVVSSADREKVCAIALATGSEGDLIPVLVVHKDSSHA